MTGWQHLCFASGVLPVGTEDTHLLFNHALFEMPRFSALKKWLWFFPSCFPVQGEGGNTRPALEGKGVMSL